jgi:hypothetical protein
MLGAGAPAQEKAGVSLKGSVDDVALQAKAPKAGVVVSEAGWKALRDAWGIKDAPKIDFEKTLLVVATTRGSILKVSAVLKDGNLKTSAVSSRDLRPGFRFAIEAVAREGVTTVNGEPPPKE